MNLRSNDDPLFSSGKPKKLPWFFGLVMIGLAVIIILFKWFS